VSRRPRTVGSTLTGVGVVLSLAFGTLAAGAGYWQVLRAGELASSPDDAAVVAASRRVERGAILDREGRALAWNALDANGEPYRLYASASLSSVVGYASRLWGTAGLERAYDARISGVVGSDQLADMLRKFQASANDPQTIRTGLSLPLQDAAVALLGDRRGAIVMLDPRSGEVLVLASAPSFDASAVADPTTSRVAFEGLQADPALPLLPRATQGRYVPGSAFKVVTALAALGSEAVSVDTTFPEQPAAEIDGLLVSGFRVRDGHHPETGSRALAFGDAVEVSCNIWFARAGLEAGGETLDRTAKALGFGAPIPFDLPTAASQITGGGGGFGGGFEDAVELANAAFGQAETFVTPLQMALVAAAVANGGTLMAPRLVTAVEGRTGGTPIGPEVMGRVADRAVTDAITAAMVRAVEGDLGRRFTKGAAVEGVHVAGKSGTAETGSGTEPHSWFIGFAPADAPTIVIAVVVEGGGHGDVRAPAIAGQLLRAYLGGGS